MKISIFLISLFTINISLFAKDYNVLNYGINPDGKTKNTEKIQALINKAAESGGGTIHFPKGTYLTGSIQLRSNIKLYFAKGAQLLGSANPYDYKRISESSKHVATKKDDNSKMALITAENLENIQLCGDGTIDGQGRSLALAIDSLHHIGEVVDPHYSGRPNEQMRPKLFLISECKNITISDLHLQNSACWGLSFELCNNMRLENLTINNRAYWNNDGMDITDSKDVVVKGCYVNTADDGICLKSYYKDKRNENIQILDCTICTSASAIKFGTASFGGFKDVTIKGIKIFDTMRSVIAFESVDGAKIENILVDGVVAKNVGNAFYIRLGNRNNVTPGSVKNITIKNLTAEISYYVADRDYDMRGPMNVAGHNPWPASIVGMPGEYIDGVTLENIKVTYPGRASKGIAYIPLSQLFRVPEKSQNYPEYNNLGELPSWAIFIRHAKNIKVNNAVFKLKQKDFRTAIVLDDVKHYSFDNLNVDMKKGGGNTYSNNTEK